MTDLPPPMKLTLDVNRPPNGQAFQPGDNVNGRVQLQMADGLEVPDIQIIFQGSAKISLQPGYDAINQVAETHKQETTKLFDIQKILLPTRDWKTDASLQTYSASFSIPFPQYAQCCSSGSGSGPAKPQCNLPPSTRISSAGLKATIAYTVTAACRRPRGRQSRFNLLNYVQRSLTACQAISFVPPADAQLQVPDIPIVVPVITFVRPNAPLAGRPSTPRPQSPQQLRAVPPFTHSPLPSRAGCVSSQSQADTLSRTSASEAPTESSRSSLSDSPPVYSPPNTTTGCAALVSSTAWLPASKLNFDVYSAPVPAPKTRRQSSTGDSAPPPGCLPAYTPSMTLEAVMPNLPIVVPGQPLPLSLFILTPQPLLAASAASGSQLVLRSLTVRLRRVTIARIGTSMRADDASWPLWSFDGYVPIRNEKLDAASLSWDTRSGIPSAVFPGFWSCLLSRSYMLEITMGVATQAAPRNVGYAKTSIRVMVSEPPPAYIIEE